MPRTPKTAARYEPPDFVHAKKKKAKKKPAPKQKKKTITHTDDGVPIVNASMAQIRKGLSGKAATQLVRIPQVAERSKFYVEAAEIIGERESHALPYHGGRMWKVEVKVSDDKGAYGDNCKGKGRRSNNNDDEDEDGKKKKKTNYNALTPLFRWYRGKLELATMPHILENIEEVEHNQSKAKWARGLKDVDISDDDSSEEEDWDDDKFIPETEKNFTMEISSLTTSAYEDSSHALPDIRRTWISPDMQRFQSRKSAIAHAEKLTKKDLLIDRVMFGVGCHGVRLRPVKPTRKLALEAGEARFVRDGLWTVGQEEVWIVKRREIYIKKQEKWLQSQEQEQQEKADSTSAEEGDKAINAKSDSKEVSSARDEVKPNVTKSEEVAASNDKAKDDVEMKEVVQKVDTVAAVSSEEEKVVVESNSSSVEDNSNDVKLQSKDNQDGDCSSKTVTPVESDASTGDAPTTTTDGKPKDEDPPTKPKRIMRAPGTRPPPEFVPSTHYCLTQAQIDKCAVACNDHYEKVMDTVKARSLYHELADGFDVMRERGRGRYDMELSAFETKEFSFLTDTKKAPWMSIIHKILGEDALLVHKGCFLSLPGSETQVYHQDGLHLNKKVHKPCHAVNVFIPLIDYDMSNGPTEFCLGTHYLGRENFVKDMVYTPCVTAGTPIIFDYRLGHRGLRNISDVTRPVVYLTYSAVKSGKEFRDEVNFSKKRYKKLGDFVEKRLPRGERLKKRRKVNTAGAPDVGQKEQNVCIGVGSVVVVESRMWPGVNKEGGVGRVTNIHLPAGPEAAGFVKKYDITYVLGGKEEKVEEEYVSLPVGE